MTLQAGKGEVARGGVGRGPDWQRLNSIAEHARGPGWLRKSLRSSLTRRRRYPPPGRPQPIAGIYYRH